MEGKALPRSAAPILVAQSRSGTFLLISSCSLLQARSQDFNKNSWETSCFWAEVKGQSMETAIKLLPIKVGFDLNIPMAIGIFKLAV